MSKLFLILSFVLGLVVGFASSKMGLFKGGKKTRVTKTETAETTTGEDADDDSESKQKRPYVFGTEVETVAAHYDIAVSARELVLRDLNSERKGELKRKLNFYLAGPGATCASPNCLAFAQLLNQIDQKLDSYKTIKDFPDTERNDFRKELNALVAKLALKPALDQGQAFKPIAFTMDGFGVFAMATADRKVCKERGDILAVVTGNPHILFVGPNVKLAPVITHEEAIAKSVCVYQQHYKNGKTWVTLGDEILKYLNESRRMKKNKKPADA